MQLRAARLGLLAVTLLLAPTPLWAQDGGNANFNTGVEDLEDQPIDQIGERVPPDDGFGVPGDGTFNTPPLVEAADTGPFFHNNSIDTIEGAVAFYNGAAFNNSPAGLFLASIDARIYDNDYPPLGTDRNTADVRNLFVGFDKGQTSARVGRTDLKGIPGPIGRHRLEMQAADEP